MFETKLTATKELIFLKGGGVADGVVVVLVGVVVLLSSLALFSSETMC